MFANMRAVCVPKKPTARGSLLLLEAILPDTCLLPAQITNRFSILEQEFLEKYYNRIQKSYICLQI